jgi:alanine-synthesizing transaminase
MRAQVFEFEKIKRLPPYVFAIVTAMKLEARRRGEDIIDFGMGNPDQPTPPHIVAKAIEAIQNSKNHRYSASKGIPKLRRAITDWYKRNYDVDLDPDTEAIRAFNQQVAADSRGISTIYPGGDGLVVVVKIA